MNAYIIVLTVVLIILSLELLWAVIMLTLDSLDLKHEIREWVLSKLIRKDGE